MRKSLLTGAASIALTAAPAVLCAQTMTPVPAPDGTTTVTTAPGIATTLLGAGIVPLPQSGTRFRRIERLGRKLVRPDPVDQRLGVLQQRLHGCARRIVAGAVVVRQHHRD